jgi:hypothetical protein
MGDAMTQDVRHNAVLLNNLLEVLNEAKSNGLDERVSDLIYSILSHNFLSGLQRARECITEGCGIWFIPERDWQKYHNDNCRSKDFARRKVTRQREGKSKE